MLPETNMEPKINSPAIWNDIKGTQGFNEIHQMVEK